MTPESLVAWKAARAERNRKLDRATQALKDASLAYAAAQGHHTGAKLVAEWWLPSNDPEDLTLPPAR